MKRERLSSGSMEQEGFQYVDLVQSRVLYPIRRLIPNSVLQYFHLDVYYLLKPISILV